MIDRLFVILIAACAVLLGQVVVELLPSDPESAGFEAPSKPMPIEPMLASAAPKPEELSTTALAAPLFSRTRRPAEQAGAETVQELPDLRLAGTIIEPGHRIAIFAVPGAKPLVRSEGEALNGWRLENILPHAVSLSGRPGTRTLEAKPDQTLKRQPVVANGQQNPALVLPARPPAAVRTSTAPAPMAPMPPLPPSGRGVGSSVNSPPRP